MSPPDMGVEDYFKDLNAREGVEGAQSQIHRAWTPATTWPGAFRPTSGTGPSPGSWWSTPSGPPSGKQWGPLATKDKLVQIVPGDGEFQAKLGRIFIWGPAYQDAFSASMDWVISDWKAKGKSGMPKFGFISWD